MFRNNKLYKLLYFALILGFILYPTKIEAKEQNITEKLIKFLPRIQQELIVNDTKKFIDDTPSLVFTEPIENVNDYLPVQQYPKSIYTPELLDMIAPRKDIFRIIDIETKASFQAMRYGGNKHLDAEPKSYEDAVIMNSINGKSWSRRAILVYFNGEYYAASMHTMPHGNGFIDSNGYNGHFCIHVLESKTHGGGKTCEQHQECVQKALTTEIGEIVNTISPTK